MQSHDEAIHLLPALPDIWKDGEITGLRARGGFEIVSLKWKNGKIDSVVIKSNLGGNLRLRTHDPLNMNEKEPAKAKGTNTNPMFTKQQISRPLVSEKAPLKGIELKDSHLYDIPTEAGQTYTLAVK